MDGRTFRAFRHFPVKCKPSVVIVKAREINSHLFLVLDPVVYQSFLLSKSFSNAQAYCQSHGGNLASFVSQDEINAIIEVLSNSAWTGLYCKKTSKAWSFIDGSNTTFAMSLLQSSCNCDKCVKINEDGTLDPVQCDTSTEFVCQTGHRIIDPTNPPGSTG